MFGVVLVTFSTNPLLIYSWGSCFTKSNKQLGHFSLSEDEKKTLQKLAHIWRKMCLLNDFNEEKTLNRVTP